MTAQTDSSKTYYSLDKIRWVNPWLSGGNNMAGMVLNDDIFKGFNAFSDANLSARFTTGNLRNIYDPESEISGAFDIDSYSRLGKVFLRGRFGYEYDYNYASRWRGLLNPYETPFMMADSIPGNLSMEMYRMEAGIGIPLSRHFALGVDIKYDVGLMAKHKDLRNKNTYMNFDISPGFIYNGKSVKAGLNLGYIRNTEKIEYVQIDQNTDKYLFSLYGLWLNYSTGFSSAETSRLKENSTFYGAAQIDLSFGDVRIFDVFRADYLIGKQGETGYNGLNHGEIHQLTYSNSLTFLYGMRHRVKFDFTSYRMTGYKFLQRQELNPSSNIRVWVSYGGPINCYIRNYHSEDVNYTFRMAHSITDIRWEGTIGFKNLSTNHKYKEHPLNFSQNLNIREVYLHFTKYWRTGRSMFDLAPGISYSFTDGTENLITNVETGEEVEGQEGWQLTEELYEEFQYWKAPKINAGIGFRYGYILNQDKGLDLNIALKYNIQGATEGVRINAFRHYATLSVGLTF